MTGGPAVATPHVNWRYLNDGKTIARRVDDVNARLATEGVALGVRAGAEIDLTRISDIDSGELSKLALGGSRWLLMEPPFSAPVVGLEALLADAEAPGFPGHPGPPGALPRLPPRPTGAGSADRRRRAGVDHGRVAGGPLRQRGAPLRPWR